MWRPLATTCGLFAGLCLLHTSIYGQQRDEVPPRIAPPAQVAPGQIIERRVLPPQPRAFRLTTQEKPLVPGEPRTKPSTPASQQGLEIVVRPERKEFALNGPLSLRVTLKNVSERTLRIPAAAALGGHVELVVSNQKTGAQWTISSPAKAAEKVAAKSLKPGESYTVTLIAKAPANQWPPIERPFPLPVQPQPVDNPRIQPLPAGKPVVRPAVNDAAQPKPGPNQVLPPGGQPVPGNPRIMPRPVFPQQGMPCGVGPCRALLLLEFPGNAAAPGALAGGKLWTGRIAAQPVDFEVTAAVMPPAVRPLPRPIPLNGR